MEEPSLLRRHQPDPGVRDCEGDDDRVGVKMPDNVAYLSAAIAADFAEEGRGGIGQPFRAVVRT